MGVNSGFGLGTAEEPAPTAQDPAAKKEASVFFISAGTFIDLARVARIEAGWMMGFSAAETRVGPGDGDDQGWYLGISLRTQLGNEVIKIFR